MTHIRVDSFRRCFPRSPGHFSTLFYNNGTYSSDSNARFDQWLKSQNRLSGIKDFEEILFLATAIGLELVNDFAMPANNRLLVLQHS
jgi:hypothetical protein